MTDAPMGPFGSGKSTLMQLISALATPQEGQIRTHGLSLMNTRIV